MLELGPRLTHSMASSRDLTCQSQKPATSSLASVKGPSTTVRDLPENLTRAPLELGWRPSMASTTPALMSSLLNLPISAMSSGAGRAPSFSDSGVALTMTMNRIFFVLSELGCMWECRGLLGGGGWLGFVERADLSLRGWWGLLGFGGLVDAAKSHCFSVGESLFARSIDTSKEVWGIRPGAGIFFGFIFLGG